MKTITLVLITLLALNISFAQVTLDITNFGAIGDGATVNTSFIQSAIDSCTNAGGGFVEIPAGSFVTGTLFFKNNVIIRLLSGSTIKGSGVLADYPDVHPLIRTYTDNYPQKSVFYAEGQHHIGITGDGTFDGNGGSVPFLLNQDSRPLGFRFISCTNVLYQGISMRNSAFWMMHNFNCDTVLIRNLNIVNQVFGNNDGVNLDGCREVLVDSITADCNDDPLVIKTTSPIGCKNIEIRNCNVSTYSRAIKIGTETNGAFENIHIHDCQVHYSLLGPLGTTTAASCGLNLSVVDGGSMKNVLIENVSMEGVETPLLIRLGNRGRNYTDTAAAPGIGEVNGVTIRNVTANATTNITSTITGIPNHKTKNVTLQNVSFNVPGGFPAIPLNYPVPENQGGKPDNDIFGDTLPVYGLYVRHVDSLTLDNFCVTTDIPDNREGLYFEDVSIADTNALCFFISTGRIEKDFGLRMFPNPVNELISVRSEEPIDEIEIFNQAGERVLYKNISQQKYFNLQIKDIAPGLYFLSLKSNHKTRNEKLCVIGN